MLNAYLACRQTGIRILLSILGLTLGEKTNIIKLDKILCNDKEFFWVFLIALFGYFSIIVRLDLWNLFCF
ncbi:MAG: hypothetical protein ISS47_09755 [Candidatus Omnitrophica bacterium]|nr:hypothetical protein [Candidatus Omnitrophota bacterium]